MKSSFQLCDSTCLGGETFGVAWEHRSLADVIQAQIQHDDTFHSNAATGVRWAAKAESLDVGGDFGNV